MGAVVAMARVQVGDNVVVIGLGDIGASVIQGAKFAGTAKIIGIVINPAGEA